MDIDTILQRLEKVKLRKPNSWLALCPCHDDTNPSLSITQKSDKILMNCFACKANGSAICRELGLNETVMFKPKND